MKTALSISKKEYYSEITSLAIPAFLEKLLLTLVGLVSTVVIGKAVGSEAMSSLTVATTVNDILQSVFIGFGFGASIIIAREKGGEKSFINQTTLNSIYLNAAFGLMLSVICMLFLRGILGFMFSSKTAAVTEGALSYLYTILPFSLVASVDVAVSSCLRGAHDAKTPFYVTAGVNVVNALCCILFIGILDMSIKGAAISYIISTCLGCIIRISLLFKKSSAIHLDKFHRPDFSLIRRILNASVSSTLQAFFINFAFLGVQAVTSMISAAAMAGYQIANNILKLTYCITHGVEAAQITLVGNSLSVNDEKRAKIYSYKLLKTSEAVCLIWAAIMFVFAKPLSGIFLGSGDETTLQTAVTLLRILCFTVPFTTYYQSSQGTLKVGGETAPIVLSSILGPWVIRIPLAYLLVKLIVEGTLWSAFESFFSSLPLIYPYAKAVLTNGITGLIFGLFADYIMRTLVYGIRLHKEKWLSNKL